MRWVTLMTTDNVEHTINMASIVQIIARSGRHQAGATVQRQEVSDRRL